MLDFFKKSNKKSMSISTVLFVIMVIILFTTALTLFYLRVNNYSRNVNTDTSVEELQYKQILLDFYLNAICEKTDVNNAVESFKLNLAKYKLKDGTYVMPELSEVEKQANQEHIVVENNKIKVSFSFELSGSSKANNGEQSKLEYKFNYPQS